MCARLNAQMGIIMNKNEIMDELGVLEIGSEAEVKQAYREKLVFVNPEDDPQGFMKLRKAYEEALAYLEKTNDDIGEENEEANFISALEDVYSNILKRRDLQQWKKTLDVPYANEMETENDAMILMLRFLSGHFYIPQDVCVFLCDKIKLKESILYFSDYVPKDFLEYLLTICEKGIFIDFDLFEGQSYGDFDGYIAELYQIVGEINQLEVDDYKELLSVFYELEIEGIKDGQENTDKEALRTKCDQILEQIKANSEYPFSHFFMDIQKLKVGIINKDKELIRDILSMMTAEKRKNRYVAAQEACGYFAIGEYEKAKELALELLALDPEHVVAKRIVCDIELVTGAYYKAKEGYYDILEDDHYNRRVIDCVKIASKGLILELCQKTDVSSQIELAWNYYENEEYQKAYDLLQVVTPYLPDDQYLYYSTISRVCLELKMHKDSIAYARNWIIAIGRLEEDGSKKKQRRKKRVTYASSLVVENYMILANEPDVSNEKKQEYLKEALSYTMIFDMVEDLFEKLQFFYQKARLLRLCEKQEESNLLCNHLLEIQPDYIPAMFLRQENNFEQRKVKEVYDDFKLISEKIPKYMHNYYLTAKLCLEKDYYKDALDIIEKAKLVDELSFELQAIYAEIILSGELDHVIDKSTLRGVEETRSRNDSMTLLIEELREKKQKEPVSAKNDLIFDKILTLYYFVVENYEQSYLLAIAVLNREESANFIRLFARILVIRSGTKEAIAYLEDITNRIADARLFCLLGYYYEKCNMLDSAIRIYKLAMNTDKNYERAYEKMITIHMDNYLKTGELHSLQRAEKNAELYIKRLPSKKSYLKRAILYMDSYRNEEAIIDLKKALEFDSTDVYVLQLLGKASCFIRDYKTAEENYRLAKERTTMKESLELHYLFAEYLLSQNRTKEARPYFEELINYKPNVISLHVGLKNVYKKEQSYQRFVQYLDYMIMKFPTLTVDLLVEKACVLELMLNHKEAEKCYLLALKKNDQAMNVYLHYADFLDRKHKKLSPAIKQLQIALKKGPENRREFDLHYLNLIQETIRRYKMNGNHDKINSLVQEWNFYLQQYFPSVEVFSQINGMKNTYLFAIGNFYESINNIQMAHKFFNAMDRNYVCTHCKYGTCVEWHIGQAVLAETAGNFKLALEHIQILIAEKYCLEKMLSKRDELVRRNG